MVRELMNKYIFTFGTDHLKNFDIPNANDIIVVVEGIDEQDARNTVFESPIGAMFCTSYPYSYAENFKNCYHCKEMTFCELMERQL